MEVTFALASFATPAQGISRRFPWFLHGVLSMLQGGEQTGRWEGKRGWGSRNRVASTSCIPHSPLPALRMEGRLMVGPGMQRSFSPESDPDMSRVR